LCENFQLQSCSVAIALSKVHRCRCKTTLQPKTVSKWPTR